MSHGVNSLNLGDKIQLAKFGNSKIFVVKKKQAPQIQVNQPVNLASSGPFSNLTTMVSAVSQQTTPLNAHKNAFDEFQNSNLTQSAMDQKNATLKFSRSLTPLKNSNGFQNGTQTADIIIASSPDKGTPQMINVNNSYNTIVGKDSSFHNTMPLNSTQKHVNFILHQSQQTVSSQNSSIEKIEENRRLNSRRQFQIRKHSKKSKERGMKSPSDFTNCGKSVVSLFSTQSGKTNHSAPLGLSNSLNHEQSPQTLHQIKVKKDSLSHSKKHERLNNGGKKKIRPSSSHSPGQFKKERQNQFSMTATNFNVSHSNLNSQNGSVSKDRSSTSLNGKKIIPLKQIKFPLKKHNNSGAHQVSSSALPKPPLHKKQNLFDETIGNTSNTEALLKMADENLKSIEHDLSQNSRKNSKQSSLTRSDIQVKQTGADKKAINIGAKPKIKDIQTNFNLSFNNSFNTSYNNTDANKQLPPQHQQQTQQQSPFPENQVLAFSSSATPQASSNGENVTQFQGYFTADAIYLEKQLTNRLKEASDNEGKKMQAFNQTFNEIIKRDKNFGSLLLKIKQAYDDYLRKTLASQINSPVTKPTYEELQHKVESQEIELKAQKNKNDDVLRQLAQLKEEIEEKKRQVDLLNLENDRLNGNFESFKVSNVHTKSVSNNETLKSLQFSNSSNRTALKKQHILQQVASSQSINSGSVQNNNNNQMIQDLNFLVSQNIELTHACQTMQNELTYLKLREKKIMYLVYVLQSKGYPVNQVFEQEVKPIPTLRFQEFLDNHPDLEDQLHVEGDDDPKNLFSFRSDDSFELLVRGPAIIKKRPSFVPPINLDGLPVYESSSSEGDPEPHQLNNGVGNNYQGNSQTMQNPQYYQESLKYIENFYNKYAPQMQKNASSISHSIEGGSFVQQLSSQDCLSRDEDDIREEFNNYS